METTSTGELPKTTVGFQAYEDVAVISTAGPLEFSGAWTEGAFWIDWGAGSCSGSGETCLLRVYFSPGSAGPKAGALHVMVDGYEDWVLPLSGEAFEPRLALEPASVDFGTQRLYQGQERQLQVRNSGEAPLQLSGIDVEGPDSGRFWNGGSDCWSLPDGWLDPGESCSAAVYFQPEEVRDYEATLKVSVNGYYVTAPLSGAGGQAVMKAAANPVDLGAVTVGTAGDLATIELVNEGNLPGSFFIAVIAGGDARSFELIDESCSGFTPVAPGEACRVRVRFAPQSSGPKQARLALFGDDDGGTMIVLTGEGVAPVVGFDLVGIHFGAVATGARSAPQPFVVRNGGATALQLGGVGIVGADPDQFLLAGDECTGATLAAGQACRLRVRFAPGGLGAKAAALRVGVPGGALTAGLSGTGVASAAEAKRSKHKGKRKRRAVRRNATIHNRKAKRDRRRAKKRSGKAGRHHSRDRLDRG
ncbi:MAG: choice-of-anchor D domain-containing protein [Solirubrobacterales bacterium]